MSEISVDVTVHAAEDTEDNMVQSAKGVKVTMAKNTSEEIPTASPKSTGDQDADQIQEIISVSPSDDEHTDNDGEEDEGKFSALLPLGTSDLDISDDWRDSGGHMYTDDILEEDQLQDLVSDDAAKAVTLTPSKVANPSMLNGAWPIQYETLPNP